MKRYDHSAAAIGKVMWETDDGDWLNVADVRALCRRIVMACKKPPGWEPRMSAEYETGRITGRAEAEKRILALLRDEGIELEADDAAKTDPLG